MNSTIIYCEKLIPMNGARHASHAVAMHRLRAKTSPKVKFWVWRIFPYPIEYGNVESIAIQHGMVCSRYNKDGIGHCILPGDEHFCVHSWYPRILANSEIPKARVLADRFACCLIDYWTRFWGNI